MDKHIDKFIVCACNSTEHQIRFQLFGWKRDGRNCGSDVAVEVHLCPERSFWRRFWSGARYILGFASPNGHFDELVLNREKAQEIVAFLEEYIQSNDIEPKIEETYTPPS